MPTTGGNEKYLHAGSVMAQLRISNIKGYLPIKSAKLPSANIQIDPNELNQTYLITNQ